VYPNDEVSVSELERQVKATPIGKGKDVAFMFRGAPISEKFIQVPSEIFESEWVEHSEHMQLFATLREPKHSLKHFLIDKSDELPGLHKLQSVFDVLGIEDREVFDLMPSTDTPNLNKVLGVTGISIPKQHQLNPHSDEDIYNKFLDHVVPDELIIDIHTVIKVVDKHKRDKVVKRNGELRADLNLSKLLADARERQGVKDDMKYSRISITLHEVWKNPNYGKTEGYLSTCLRQDRVLCFRNKFISKERKPAEKFKKSKSDKTCQKIIENDIFLKRSTPSCYTFFDKCGLRKETRFLGILSGQHSDRSFVLTSS